MTSPNYGRFQGSSCQKFSLVTSAAQNTLHHCAFVIDFSMSHSTLKKKKKRKDNSAVKICHPDLPKTTEISWICAGVNVSEQICVLQLQMSENRDPGTDVEFWVGTRLGNSADREYKSREVAQSPFYVIVHSLLEVSFCTQPFPTPSGRLWSLWFLTLVIYMWRREWKVGKGRSRAYFWRTG